jgi:UDP-sulfoquinovose synthase
VLEEFQPDAVVHLAEMPSAAYSMIDAAHTAFTQQNNVIGTLNLLWALKTYCPDAHLVKLGTLGEYGTPNLDIPEGFFEVEYRGRKDILPFPRQAGSFYHWSKVHDSNNIMFACKIWGVRSTDIMQGIVFGTRFNDQPAEARMCTRLDFDQCFGTVINRFCCQAIIGHPLTIYGEGGQRRGILPLRDSMQCLALILANPPEKGEYRVFNQFDSAYSVYELAKMVQSAGQSIGLDVQMTHVENPRIELQDHYYNPSNEQLRRLGYCPSTTIQDELVRMLMELKPYARRITEKMNVFLPDIQWSDQH